jgi:hypothetical protein
MKPFYSIMVGWIASLPVVFFWAFTSFRPPVVYFGFLVLITFLISFVIGYPLCALAAKSLRRSGRCPSYIESALIGGFLAVFTLLVIFVPFFTFAAPAMLIGIFPATLAAALQGGVAATIVRKNLQP